MQTIPLYQTGLFSNHIYRPCAVAFDSALACPIEEVTGSEFRLNRFMIAEG